ncbi:kinesin-like protein KIF16B [Patella vulgata]|uniref:kinesin-like protein KIF16B n=1 Tax=Patella vulgata TaxID=6465 RepID=UPI0024A7ECD5|nr:kinesin-like protein KIF16B [Patella vulgata]
MSNVKVAVRVRPLSNREREQGSQTIIEVIGDVIALTNLKVDPNNPYGDNREREKHFCYDFCYNSTSKPDTPGYGSQEQIFQDLGTDVIQSAVEGYNACLFAYGQTSTGKTYTMTGTEEEVGLIPRICEGLFSHIESEQDEKITFKVEISYLEIYNERVRDLLKSGFANEKYTLKVREHPKEGPYVQDLSSHRVKNLTETLGFLERGNDNRTTAATHMHEHSSRSHAIVTLVFTQALFEDDLPREIVSKIHLVDLAGSERADTTSTLNYKGRLKEGANINKSLVTLGNVIKALAERSLLSWTQMGSTQSVTSSSAENSAHSPSSPRRHQTVFIPYRDSVLTWLLRDSLGGNSKTIMISTVTPASKYYNESLSTLRYAQRAKNIVNKPKINEDTNVALIRQLQEEIKRLKHELANAQMAGLPVPVRDKGTVVEKLQEKENMAKQLTQSWRDKWNDPMEQGDDDVLCFHELRRASSHGIILDSQIPHLIGMDEDILSTGVIIYQLDVSI